MKILLGGVRLKSISESPAIRFIKKGGGFRVGILLALGIILLLFGAASEEKSDAGIQYEEEIRLTELCRRVKGVGDCYVMIGYTTERVGDYSSSSEKRVSSVTVLCDGADSTRVKGELVELITSLYGIGSNRVTVLRCK